MNQKDQSLKVREVSTLRAEPAGWELLENACEYWLGYSLPPVERVLREAGWKADSPDAYCPRCGVSVAFGEATESGCGTCRDRPAITGKGGGVVRLGSYSDDLRQWVLAIKYKGYAEMGWRLGRELGQSLASREMMRTDMPVVIVPMPMPWQRRMYRGIDHAHVIASGVADQLGAPILRLLSKRNGPPQVTLPRSQRRRSGSQGLKIRAFGRYVPGGRWVAGTTVILVDDVCTTGATLKAASRLLRLLKPSQVIAAVIVVSDDKARRQKGDLPSPPED